ncbi:MAG: ABC transporter ATP-binding protein [Anaerolineales bacterium]|jgi:oligopeptide transport system ATP-binding protein
MNPLLQIKDLQVQFKTIEGTVHAVNGISYDLDTGQTLGIVGESGCGKSVSVLTIMRLIDEPPGKIAGGEVNYRDQDLLKMDKVDIQCIRGKDIAMVFQDPMTSLNPVLTIGRQLIEAQILHLGITKEEAHSRAIDLLTRVGIPKPDERLDEYPHQFSGGMRQRVMMAMALSCLPSILIADEPTTALDVTIQAQIVELTKKLRDQMDMAVIWITHDLAVIAELADRIIVMYAGFIVEEADVFQLFSNPLHPYTLSLLKSIPRVDKRIDHRLATISGFPPENLTMPPGCSFAPRCDFCVDRCWVEVPDLEIVEPDHKIACWVDVTTGKER